MVPIIEVDFNNMTADDRVSIGPDGAWQVERYRPLGWLKPGAQVKLLDDDLEVGATLEYDSADGWWIGKLDWPSRRDLASELDSYEEFREAQPELQLAILRLLMVPRASGLNYTVQALTREADLSKREYLINSLARYAADMNRILDILTPPFEVWPP